MIAKETRDYEEKAINIYFGIAPKLKKIAFHIDLCPGADWNVLFSYCFKDCPNTGISTALYRQRITL